MRCERVHVDGPAPELAARLRSLIPAPDSVRDAVAEILAAVRSGGDAAVREYTTRFDTAGAEPHPVTVSAEELDAAAGALDPAVAAGLKQAMDAIRRVGEASLREDRAVVFDDHEVTLRSAPVGSAAVYVPGGRAPYPSTVAMGVVTARAAGVAHVAVCSPPGRDGDVNTVVLGAAALARADAVYRVGGAQAIAALAYGTAEIAAVDVIVGPGNLYVQEAKRQVSGEVGIDSFAGPTDLVAVAADGADARALVLDVLAQAEHGAGSLVVVIGESPALTDAIAGALDHAGAQLETAATVVLVDAPDLDAALALAQALAPEHLQLMGAAAQRRAPEMTRAGCVFVGNASGTAFGDYIAGSNHILPTNGSARFASALSAEHFRRRFTEVRITDGSALARAAAPIARAEGFEYHARSMEARIRQNGAR
jgi:histidinol dehydrogenase